MFTKTTLLLAACCALAACAADKPHIIQATGDIPEVHLTAGMATQIEMSESGDVQSVVTGNPNLVTAERAQNVVNLIPKESSGETNLIVRFITDDGDTKVFQYRLSVQDH